VSDFAKTIAEAYAVESAAIDLGRGVHDDELAPEAVVQVPVKLATGGPILRTMLGGDGGAGLRRLSGDEREWEGDEDWDE
jgi:hypothetical protein